ncbi:MAG: 4Fe-4S binding protein [Huintestinicola sp.]
MRGDKSSHRSGYRNQRPHWSGSCIHCMSCINRCPVHAIEYGSKTAGKIRYVSPKYHSEKNN